MHKTTSLPFKLVLCGLLLAAAFMAQSWASKAVFIAFVSLVLLSLLIDWLAERLPKVVTKIRKNYESISLGIETIVVPNKDIKGKDVERLFMHEHADLKTGGIVRTMIRWWHEPSGECHQKLIEKNEIYAQVAPVTARLLTSMSPAAMRELAVKYVDEVVRREKKRITGLSVVRIRSFVYPIAVSFLYEFIFRETCPKEAMSLISISASDVAKSTRAYSRRDMKARDKLFRYLRNLIEKKDGCPHIFGEDSGLSLDQKAKYLQSVWFHTGIVQITRMTGNALTALAKNKRCLVKLRAEEGEERPYLNYVIMEILRLYPGVGRTNRVTSKDIDLTDKLRIPAGTNVVFDLETHQLHGFDDAPKFIPERWEGARRKDSNYMPFGVGKRRCPGEPISLVVAREIILGVTTAFDIDAPITREIGRPDRPELPNDMCCLSPRGSSDASGGMKLYILRRLLGWRLTLELVKNSLTQIYVMPRNVRDAIRDEKFR